MGKVMAMVLVQDLKMELDLEEELVKVLEQEVKMVQAQDKKEVVEVVVVKND